ncbi:DNA damage-regulated autophagy modulator protein [Dermatophagoides pteronyssinus]|uniref:DNA damage-regulated autophagy modulator protein n=1 Tax=Dermatophagoides pteronyssinus TaxID=6956 RepID=A0ABQ8JFY3_DERPT|nr:DNA damage-regulated autophagy modulator protein [Dermatophagoides pteronyssinus]
MIYGFLWLFNILVGYFIVYTNYHSSIPPYITDIGNFGRLFPGYFSFINHILIILFIITIVYRYKQLKFYFQNIQLNQNNNNNEIQLKKLLRQNHFALIAAILSIIGTLIWLNFHSNQQLIIHSIGVLWMYFWTTVYMFIMCYLTKKLNDYGHIETKPISMFIITIIYTISAWLSVLFFIIFVLKFSKFHYYERGRFRRYWPYYNYNDNDDYRLYRLLANINSWIMIIAHVMFIWSIGTRIRLFINKNYKYNDNNNNDGK